MLHLHYYPSTASMVPHIVLEELGVPYQRVLVDQRLSAARQALDAPRTWELGNAAINRLLWSPQGFALVGWADAGHLAALDMLDESST